MIGLLIRYLKTFCILSDLGDIGSEIIEDSVLETRRSGLSIVIRIGRHRSLQLLYCLRRQFRRREVVVRRTTVEACILTKPVRVVFPMLCLILLHIGQKV
jgi:hypothetical protein